MKVRLRNACQFLKDAEEVILSELEHLEIVGTQPQTERSLKAVLANLRMVQQILTKALETKTT